MKKALLALALAASGLTAACTDDYAYGGRPGYDNGYHRHRGGYGGVEGGWAYRDDGYYRRYGNYDYNRPDPSYGGYYADRYYREDPRYGEHRLSMDERVYRGGDGRYYCRRSDGSTGLIVGGVSGALLGSVIANGIPARWARSSGPSAVQPPARRSTATTCAAAEAPCSQNQKAPSHGAEGPSGFAGAAGDASLARNRKLLGGFDVDAELLHVVEREADRTVVEGAFHRLLADVQFERHLAGIGGATDDLFFALGFGGVGVADALVGEAVGLRLRRSNRRSGENESGGSGRNERTKHGNFPDEKGEIAFGHPSVVFLLQGVSPMLRLRAIALVAALVAKRATVSEALSKMRSISSRQHCARW
jgi:hypothetical protein